MKKAKTTARRCLAVFLTLMMLVLPMTVGFSFAVEGAVQQPKLMIHGITSTVRDTPDGTVALYDDGDYISQLFPDGIPLLAKGILTGCWDDWCEFFLDTMAPAYENYALALDGSIPQGSHSFVYGLSGGEDNFWHYYPDERLSPLDVAADIAEKVDEIRAISGQEKIAVIGRCEGSAYATAYINAYERPRDYAGVSALILSDPTVYGIHYIEAIFSGNVHIDGTDTINFLKSESSMEVLLGSDTAETVNKVADVLKNTYGIELTASVLNRMYAQVKDKLFAPFLRMFYARGLGTWSTVYHRFDEAVEYLFPTPELKNEYAYFIDKATAFHEVASDIPAMVAEMQAANVLFADLVEYGFPMYPLSDDASEVGDALTGVKYKGFGAKVSRADGTLPERYISERVAAGYAEYISPDAQIDASAGLFPDNTWFIKNLNHAIPAQIYEMYTAIVNDRITDVHADARYPQFLNFDPDSPVFIPAAQINATDKPIEYNFIERIKLFIHSVFQKLHSFFAPAFRQ